jgi:hypothetical protein
MQPYSTLVYSTWDTMDWMLVLTAGGSIGTLIGVGAAWHFARRAEAASTASHRLAAHSAVHEWQTEIRGWAAEAIDVLAEGQYAFASEGSEASPARAQSVHRLSALVDRGRFFLPNQDRDKHGLEKSYAYRGFRHATLDPLVAALRVLDGKVGPTRFASPGEAVWEMRKLFVSRVHLILDPDLQNASIGELIREVHAERSVDPTLGGLLPARGQLPSGAESLLSRQAISPPASPGPGPA